MLRHVATIFGSLLQNLPKLQYVQFGELHGADDVVFSSCVFLHAPSGYMSLLPDFFHQEQNSVSLEPRKFFCFWNSAYFQGLMDLEGLQRRGEGEGCRCWIWQGFKEKMAETARWIGTTPNFKKLPSGETPSKCIEIWIDASLHQVQHLPDLFSLFHHLQSPDSHPLLPTFCQGFRMERLAEGNNFCFTKRRDIKAPFVSKSGAFSGAPGLWCWSQGGKLRLSNMCFFAWWETVWPMSYKMYNHVQVT